MFKTASSIAGVVAALMCAGPAISQDNYPSAPIRVVVGFAPGGITDVVARLLSQKLATQMNGSVLVENKVGANTSIAAEYVARSRPDGYNLLFATPSQVLSPAFGEKLSYDLFKDFTPITLYATSPQLLFVNPSVPSKTAAEFIAYVKANPDKLAYGSAGAGSIVHLGAALFLQTNGLSALHVPYKGSAPALQDLIGGRIQFAMQSQSGMPPLVKEGRVKALGIASLKRSSQLADVPTLSESGMPGFQMGSWNGVLAAAQTPPAIVRRLNAEMLKSLQDNDMKAKFAQEGVEALGSSPEEFSTYLKGEVDRWTKVIKTGNIKLE